MIKDDDIHCMLDLETLGHNSDAAIIQIGSCIFNKTNILAKLRVNINWEDALKYGKVTASTLKWWMSQSDEARNSVTLEKETSLSACNIFTGFCGAYQNKYRIDHFWSHASFDFPIFTNLCKNLGLLNPIDFRKCRDLRTMDALFPIDWPERTGIHHDALDDAVYQANCLQMQFKEILGR